jgi:hypothetical protein
MALKTNTAEGQTNATTVTVANSDDFGDAAVGTPVIGAGSSIQYDTSQHMHGSASFKFVAASGVSDYIPIALTSSNGTLDASYYYRYPGNPSVENRIGHVVTTGTTKVSICVNTNGTLRLRDAASGGAATAIGTASFLTSGTWYRLEVKATKGTTTTDGVIHLAIFTGDGTTALATFDATNYNTGTANFTDFYFGRSGAIAAAETWYLDDLQVQDGLGSSTYLKGTGVVVPVANAGPDQGPLAGNATCTLAGSGTNTPTSYAWTQTSGTTVTLSSTTAAAPTFTTPSDLTGGTLIFSFTATNAAGTSTADTVSITYDAVSDWIASAGGSWVPTLAYML